MRILLLIAIFCGGACCNTVSPVCPHCGRHEKSAVTTASTASHLLPNGGYVYVIANPRALGKDIYKIGMTRRADPSKRIKELGDSSVPFPFTAVCILQTDSPRELESFLHKHLKNKRLSKDREFFKLSLNELKEALKMSQSVIPSRSLKIGRD